MATPSKITVAERAQLFAQATRQNIQMLSEKTVTQGSSTMQFDLPKARLLSKVLLNVTAKINITHASKTTVPSDQFTPYKLIRRMSLDLNNGFSPYVIGGKELAVYNAMRQNPEIIFPQNTNPRGYCYMPDLKASTAGTSQTIAFTVALPVTLNDRDPVGLILLQSQETNVQIAIDIANDQEIIKSGEGYTVKIEEVKIRPCVESFSVPVVADAFPDLSVLKLVNSRTDAFNGSGQNIIKLSTGTIYRKLAFIVEDEDGNPFEDDDFMSNIELVFNQADINYSVSARALAHINESQLGHPLPKGTYVFDFSYQGIPNLGGTRDYIDTEQLTEFWLRFNSTKRGHVRTISECLARLQ